MTEIDLVEEFNQQITYLRKEGRFPAGSVNLEQAAQYYRSTSGDQQRAAQALFWLRRWIIPHRAAHLACYALEEGKDSIGVYLAINRQQMTKRQARNESMADQKQRLAAVERNMTGYQSRTQAVKSQSLQAVD